MPNFKPKNQKKLAVNKHSITTLDNKHDEKMSQFKKNSDIELPKLKSQIRKLKKKIEKSKNMKIEDKLDTVTDKQFGSYVELVKINKYNYKNPRKQ